MYRHCVTFSAMISRKKISRQKLFLVFRFLSPSLFSLSTTVPLNYFEYPSLRNYYHSFITFREMGRKRIIVSNYKPLVEKEWHQGKIVCLFIFVCRPIFFHSRVYFSLSGDLSASVDFSVSANRSMSVNFLVFFGFRCIWSDNSVPFC